MNWPPKLFEDGTFAEHLVTLDAKTRAMIEELSHERTLLEEDRQQAAELRQLRDRLTARVAQLEAMLIAAGIPVPPAT